MTRKSSTRKARYKVRRSIFIFLSGDMKVFLGNTAKQRRRIKKFIKNVWREL